MTEVAEESRLPSLPTVDRILDERFEIRGLLGDGGMGHVFRAFDRERGREVALKLIIPRYLGRSEREMRFLRELELSQRVGRHPNLVEVIDGGRLKQDGWPFLVMELVGTTDLASRLALGALEPLAAAHIARQVADALRAMHRADVVHRDVNATNVTLDGERAVLVDLSHAGDAASPRVAVGQPGRLTGPHEVPGTHHYMPCEQAWADPPEPPMDIYAFGVTLVHILTGQAPRGCGREAYIELAREGKINPPRIDVRVHIAVPPALAELAHACTAADPGERPTIEDVVGQLDEVIAMSASRSGSTMMVVPPADDIDGDADPAPVIPISKAVETKPEEQPGEPRLQWGQMIAVALAVVLVVMTTTAVVWPSVDVEAQPIGAEQRDAPEITATPSTKTELSPSAGAELDPAAGAELAPSTGVELAPSAGVESAPLVEPTLGVVPPVAPDLVRPAEATSTPDVPSVSAPVGKKSQPAAEFERATKKRARPDRSRAPAVTDDPSTDECRERRDAADEANARKDWSAVLAHAKKANCWPKTDARRLLRVRAFGRLGRHDDCVRAARGSKDTLILRMARLCEAELAHPAQP